MELPGKYGALRTRCRIDCRRQRQRANAFPLPPLDHDEVESIGGQPAGPGIQAHVPGEGTTAPLASINASGACAAGDGHLPRIAEDASVRWVGGQPQPARPVRLDRVAILSDSTIPRNDLRHLDPLRGAGHLDRSKQTAQFAQSSRGRNAIIAVVSGWRQTPAPAGKLQASLRHLPQSPLPRHRNARPGRATQQHREARRGRSPPHRSGAPWRHRP